jgi:hypothetical protein
MTKFARIRKTLIVSTMATATGLLMLASTAAADWGALGDSLTPTNVNPVAAPSIAAVGGVPYVAFTKPVGSADQVFVDRWSGSAWTSVGDGTLNVDTSANASAPSIANVAGVPYVAWTEAGHVYVKDWNGSAWAAVGGDVSVSGNAFRQSIAGVGTIPYVSFIDNGSVYVKQWNGSAWTQVGTAVNPSLDGQEDTITNIGGVPWVAYTVFNSGYDLYVATLSGGSWLSEGPLNVNANHTSQHLSLIGIGGVPFLAWEEYNPAVGDEFVYVKREGNSIISWPEVGAPLNLGFDDEAENPALGTLDGQPLIGLQESYQFQHTLWFDRLTGNSWEPIGTPLTADSGGADMPALANVGGVPYVAWQGLGATTHVIRAGALLASFSSRQALATDTSALLSARIADSGTMAPIEFQYGPGTSLTHTTPAQTTDGAGSATVDQTITGLAPSTSYSWRAIESDGTTTTAIGPTQTFTTEQKNGPGAPGKIELVVCKKVSKTVVRTRHHKRKRVKVTVQRCTTKLVSGPVKFTTAVRAR